MNKIKTIIALLILNTSILACNNPHLPAPWTQVLSVENGILDLKTTLGTGEIAFSYGFLDNIDLPTINKDKTLSELVMNNFHPMHQKYPDLHATAAKIVNSYIKRATVKRATKVKFTLPNSYLKHGEKLSRNPITINYWGINQSQKDPSDLGEDLVNMGFAHDWLGGPRQKWTKSELLHIIHSSSNYE
ncbi:hypothetical protein [uncultured Gammaproteobacteria bacterium]|uniref:hypothetical protein n=1 Tax=Bathymodiolus heckerae thiotrophic gill symbiont TaxID=1052212 RepID=UPI0010AF2FF2|nr:hypothetical protein [Bathymodiolus heckerae thiotrophic gill symbiont]CAC9439524.1 hypothetical protein [uncultured Gammaproteobacteria bacterium]SMN14157.1 hypothetical protein BHECKSOX2_1512 [Bathymodiolus heckerae thiotrophic gill symbiont]